MLSFGLNHQGLVQNCVYAESNADKIKISAENPPVPSYLKHSKKAQEQAKKKQKIPQKNTLWAVIIKMLKALILAVALFFGVAAILMKNKDKFQGKSPVSLAKAIKEDEPDAKPQNIPPIKPEITSGDKQIRNLIFNFFNMNK